MVTFHGASASPLKGYQCATTHRCCCRSWTVEASVYFFTYASVSYAGLNLLISWLHLLIYLLTFCFLVVSFLPPVYFSASKDVCGSKMYKIYTLIQCLVMSWILDYCKEVFGNRAAFWVHYNRVLCIFQVYFCVFKCYLIVMYDTFQKLSIIASCYGTRVHLSYWHFTYVLRTTSISSKPICIMVPRYFTCGSLEKKRPYIQIKCVCKTAAATVESRSSDFGLCLRSLLHCCFAIRTDGLLTVGAHCEH